LVRDNTNPRPLGTRACEGYDIGYIRIPPSTNQPPKRPEAGNRQPVDAVGYKLKGFIIDLRNPFRRPAGRSVTVFLHLLERGNLLHPRPHRRGNAAPCRHPGDSDQGQAVIVLITHAALLSASESSPRRPVRTHKRATLVGTRSFLPRARCRPSFRSEAATRGRCGCV